MNVEQISICTEEIASLLEKGAITQVTDYGFVSSSFLVSKASVGWGPIINRKTLNLLIQHRHCKMEGVKRLAASALKF